MVRGDNDYNLVEFFFTTSNLDTYSSGVSQDASMTIIIDLERSVFLEAGDCADIWLATGNMPGFQSCYLIGGRAIIRLVKDLVPNNKYSLMIMVKNPPCEPGSCLRDESTGKCDQTIGTLPKCPSAIENGFRVSVEFYQSLLLEKNAAPSPIVDISPKWDSELLALKAPWKNPDDNGQLIGPGHLVSAKWVQNTEQGIDTTAGRSGNIVTKISLSWRGVIDSDRQWRLHFYPMPMTLWEIPKDGGGPAYGNDDSCWVSSELKAECTARVGPGAQPPVYNEDGKLLGVKSNYYQFKLRAQNMDSTHPLVEEKLDEQHFRVLSEMRFLAKIMVGILVFVECVGNF